MKVLFISPYYPPYSYGGAEISTSIYVQNLPADITREVVTSNFQEHPWIHESTKVHPLLFKSETRNRSGFSLFLYGFEILITPWRNAWILSRFLRKNPFDVVHFVPNSYVNMGIVVAIFLSRIPCIIDIRDFTWVCLVDFSYPNYVETRKHNCLSHLTTSYKNPSTLLLPLLWLASLYETCLFFVYTTLLKTMLRSPRFEISAISQYVKGKLIASGFARNKITVIPNILTQKREVSAKRKLAFVYAGRIEKAKGIWNMINAFILADINGVSLEIFGDGEELIAIKQFVAAHQLKSIHIHGKRPIPEILGTYARSVAIVCVPERPEPLGRFVLDSFLTQTPLITSNIGGSAENVTNEVNGLLISPGNKNELAMAMKRIIDDEQLRERIISNLARLPDQFQTKNIFKKRLGQYTKVGVTYV